MEAQTFLNENDSYSFFERLGDLLITGPTGTNVMDLRVMLIASASR
jgi:hydroxypyruvate reductase